VYYNFPAGFQMMTMPLNGTVGTAREGEATSRLKAMQPLPTNLIDLSQCSSNQIWLIYPEPALEGN